MERIQINIRISKEEKEEIERKAKEHHMSLTTYIKYKLFVTDNNSHS